MVGANPKFQMSDRAGRVVSPGETRRARGDRAGSHRLRVDRPAAAAVAGSCPVQQVAECCHARRQFPGFDRRFLRRPLSKAAVPRSFPDRRRELQTAAQPHRAARARPIPGGFAGATASVSASAGTRRADRAGRPEILGVSLSRHQSSHRRAVPERLEGRASRPSRHQRQGFLARRNLQRQSRADARAGGFRHRQARRHRRLLPWQWCDAGARRARTPARAAADLGIRRQRRAAGAATRGRCRRIPAPANSGSPGGSSASWRNPPIISPSSTAIPAPPRRSPICRSSLSATAAASCRRPGAWRSAASAIACAACSCSMRSMANSTSSHPGSRTIDPASSSVPTPTIPSAMTRT